MTGMITATLFAWLLNTVYAVGALLIAGLALGIAQRFYGGRVRLNTELYKGNVAVGMVVAAVVLGVCLVVSSAHGSEPTDRYDRLFKHYGLRFFSHSVDWQWFKAQGIAESALDPQALSPMGAQGIMQLMPATGSEMAERLQVAYHPWSARLSIMLGVAYDRRVYDIFADEAGVERIRFMLGGYNAGPGHIIRAQSEAMALGLATDVWQSIAGVLPAVTGKHATETITYVARTELYYGRLCRARRQL